MPKAMRTNTHGILSDQLEVGVALTWHWTTLRPPCTLLDVSVYPCGEHHMEVSAHSAHDQSRVSCAAHYARAWFVLSLWLHQSTMDGQVITVTDQYPVHKYLHTLAALEQAVLRVQIPGQQQPWLIRI